MVESNQTEESSMTEHTALIALFPYAAQAASAILSLRRLGFETKNISVFGRMCASEEEDVVGLGVSDGRFVECGGPIGFWGRMCETLGEGGFFIVPRIGPIAIAGRFVRDLVAAVDDAPCGALTALGSAIWRLGIERENVLRYEIEIRANECAVLALGTREQVLTAKAALDSLGVSDFVTGTDGLERGVPRALQKVS
jgi:hypothetical protein